MPRTPINDPPPDVPKIDEASVGATASLRQQMERHREDATCASCHSKMDPLGFALENYNAIGKWRTMDGKFPVDSSGTLPNGKSFSSPAELRDLVEGSRAVTQCQRSGQERTFQIAAKTIDDSRDHLAEHD